MIQRKTQEAEYWHSFSLAPEDVEHLRTLLLDAEQPLSSRALAQALISERCRQEETNLRTELARGTIFQPKKRFQIGEKVIFPALDFRLGEIVAVRPGRNPEFGEFEVITADFGPDRRQRSFAAALSAPHKLNVDTPDLLVAGNLASPETLLATVAAGVPATLASQLASHPEFACFEDRWLLSDLLAETHVGHLNIAEALVEMRGAPVETEALLKELDLPKEIKPEILAFSLQSALAADSRFDQVGSGETRRWYLRRLEPREAMEIPEPLRPEAYPYNPDHLTLELRQMEWELDDEWSSVEQIEAADVRSRVTTTAISLTYPHLVSGTLPLNKHTRSFFPRGHGERTMVTLIDGRWGQRFPAWALHQGRYVAGLRAWYEQHKLPVGAYITLERRDQSGEVVVDFRPKRMRREWTRRAQVMDGNRLDIQLRKQEVACEYDEQMIIGDDRPEDISRLRSLPGYAEAPLPDLVYEIFVDLAGLSQQGAVHAKTVYSAINVLRRCPPGPIFAVLATDPRITRAGDGLFRLSV